ncbi:hypothetical protein P40081_23250 [Paenibacillus sp. FSL P4-0081]|uniref:hypothetical protein n=1 Tax=Paenibacillus sp. FSL P4-0081 TaxID=1536769 RepID=UPI0004F7549B|nr:hypothetical protein [Paenibacillus sp. FSL P4-0081]AIQ30751.1 hypothetical protein P40081_23250 [Paenibacillus sp. FSL P4-0081]
MKITKVKYRVIGLVVLLALLALIVYDQITLHSGLEEYRIDVVTEDFSVQNINLAAAPHAVYLAGGWFLELTGGDTMVDNVILNGAIDGVEVIDLASSKPFIVSDVMPIEGGGVIEDLRLTGRSVLHMNISYTASGISKQFSEDIRLHDKFKPNNEVTTGGYKIYELRRR